MPCQLKEPYRYGANGVETPLVSTDTVGANGESETNHHEGLVVLVLVLRGTLPLALLPLFVEQETVVLVRESDTTEELLRSAKIGESVRERWSYTHGE